MLRAIVAAAALVCVSGAVHSQTNDAAPTAPHTTLAAVLADGYEITRMVLGEGTMMLRTWSTTYTVTYVCNRGTVGSSTYDAYRDGRYHDIPCSLAR